MNTTTYLSRYNFPTNVQVGEIILRPTKEKNDLLNLVKSIFDDIKMNGDAAIHQYNQKFDGYNSNDYWVTKAEFSEAENAVSQELKNAINQAINNISIFHKAQQSPLLQVETMPGINCSRKSVAIEKVGLYIPGGTAPLFSTLLMLGIPAKIAGCKEVIVCTPVNNSGKVHPALLFTATALGIDKIAKIGGIQAIAALSIGTSSIPKVHKIFGPGNQFVTAAKTFAQLEGIAIDMPAGPSEVAILADDTAIPEFVAADLLSQAEHGIDSQVLLVTNNANLIDQVESAINKQLEALPRKEIALKALQNSKVILVNDLEEGMNILNQYAPEHLIIACEDFENLKEQVVNAGSVFLGNYSCESAGDYASGTNHTLPTNGFSTAYSGVSLDSFTKKITFQHLTKTGLQNLSDTIIQMAEAEGLKAHANAVRVRNEI